LTTSLSADIRMIMAKTYVTNRPLQVAFKEAGLSRAEIAEQMATKVKVKNMKHFRNWLDQVIEGHILVSALRARIIEDVTGGKITASMLRPDIFA